MISNQFQNMPREERNQEELARLLKEAEQAHAEYESQSIEGRDDAWPRWYAGSILRRIRKENEAEESVYFVHGISTRYTQLILFTIFLTGVMSSI